MKRSTNVQFKLVQEDKNKSRTIVDVEYNYDGKAKLNIEKVAQSMTKSVFRKLDSQKESGVNFGIKISRPFNLLVFVNNKSVLNLADCYAKTTDNGKLKVSQKLYKEDDKEAKKRFQMSVVAVVNEAKISATDFRGCVELNDKEK